MLCPTYFSLSQTISANDLKWNPETKKPFFIFLNTIVNLFIIYAAQKINIILFSQYLHTSFFALS